MVIYHNILILLIILEFKFALGGVFLKKRGKEAYLLPSRCNARQSGPLGGEL
jgi:hypothetical protein